MAKLTARILLILATIAVGRIVVGGFFQPNERNEVIVVLVPGGNCVTDTVAQEILEEN